MNIFRSISILEAWLYLFSIGCFVAAFSLEIFLRVAARRRAHELKKARLLARSVEEPQPPSPEATQPQAPEAAETREEKNRRDAGRAAREAAAARALREIALEKKECMIAEMLLRQDLISKEVLDKALEHQKRYGGNLTPYLLQFGAIDEKQLAQCLSSHFKVPYLPLEAYEISDEIVKTVPVDIAEKYWVMPVDRQGDSLMVVMIDPLDTKTLKELEDLTGLNIIPFVGIISEITQALRFYYKIFQNESGAQTAKVPPFFIDTKTYKGLERRKAIRYKARIDISFPLQDRYVKTQTFDVSRSGFGFMAQEALALGSRITLEVNLPRDVSALPISAVTEVVRCVPREDKTFDIGVRVLKISKQESDLIVGYASRHREG